MDETLWMVTPGEGLLPLRLGMTEEEVDALDLLGPIEARNRDFLGDIAQFHRLEDPHMTFRDGRVIYIAAIWHVDEVWFGETHVFRQPPARVLEILERANGESPILQSGTLKFMALGVSLIGYYEPEADRVYVPGEGQDDRLVMLHAPGILTVSPRRPHQPVSFL